MRLLRKIQASNKELERAFNALVDAINERTPRIAPGWLIRPTPTGWTPRVGRGGGGGGSGSVGTIPFEIVAAGNTEAGAPMVQVSIDSWLLRSRRAADKVTITGLGAPFEIAEGDLIWLEVNFNSAEEVTGATIEHGDPWEDYDSPIEYDDPDAENKRQTKARVVIGYTQAVPEPNPFTARLTLTTTGEGPATTMQVVQCVTTHVVLCQECFEGGSTAVWMIAPHFAPGPAVS